MKKLSIVIMAVSTVAMVSCHQNDSRYFDLNAGEYVNLQKDSSSGLMVNAADGKPVTVYVDTRTHDTISGRNGAVVNGKLVKSDSGKWTVKDDGDDYKAKSDEDAKIKIENGDTKIKDGEYTKKVDKDGDVKIETGSETIKIDGKTGKRKVKKDQNITTKVKKIFQ